ncbi:thiosulfate oxidation carrier protein SoxY [Phaeospirillum tilakii]|uniref:Thiosulfate oxidation carrier protein SoxY n=1 Tax=Phaeospirillum tilakii TaxID=741673 RepID=A0ABW5CGZ4_9PROT
MLVGLALGMMLAPAAARAVSVPPALAEALRALGLEAERVAWSSELVLTAPELAEDGAAVPVSLLLPEGTRPVELHLFAPGNRKAWLASFTPLSELARPEWRLRIRVGRSQTLAAVARLADGRLLGATAEVRITAGGGCRS